MEAALSDDDSVDDGFTRKRKPKRARRAAGAPAPAPTPVARGKAKASATSAAGAAVNDDNDAHGGKRSVASARGKRKAAASAVDDDEMAAVASKPPDAASPPKARTPAAAAASPPPPLPSAQPLSPGVSFLIGKNGPLGRRSGLMRHEFFETLTAEQVRALPPPSQPPPILGNAANARGWIRRLTAPALCAHATRCPVRSLLHAAAFRPQKRRVAAIKKEVQNAALFRVSVPPHHCECIHE